MSIEKEPEGDRSVGEEKADVPACPDARTAAAKLPIKEDARISRPHGIRK